MRLNHQIANWHFKNSQWNLPSRFHENLLLHSSASICWWMQTFDREIMCIIAWLRGPNIQQRVVVRKSLQYRLNTMCCFAQDDFGVHVYHLSASYQDKTADKTERENVQNLETNMRHIYRKERPSDIRHAE